MIKLDFIIDENVLKEDKSTDIINTDAGVLEQTYFNFPIRFNVNGIEMFEKSHNIDILVGSLSESGSLAFENKETTSYWLPIPILNIGIIGLEHVKKICNREIETTKYNLPEIEESLKFTLFGEIVEIYSSFNGHLGKADRKELLEQFEIFSNNIKRSLLHEFPELINHPGLKFWMNNQ